jgi:hypothetical protein
VDEQQWESFSVFLTTQYPRNHFLEVRDGSSWSYRPPWLILARWDRLSVEVKKSLQSNCASTRLEVILLFCISSQPTDPREEIMHFVHDFNEIMVKEKFYIVLVYSYHKSTPFSTRTNKFQSHSFLNCGITNFIGVWAWSSLCALLCIITPSITSCKPQHLQELLTLSG